MVFRGRTMLWKIIKLLFIYMAIVAMLGIWQERAHSQVPLREAQAGGAITIQHDTQPLPDTTVVPDAVSNSNCVEARGSEGKAWICGHKHRAYFSEPQALCRISGRLIICERE